MKKSLAAFCVLALLAACNEPTTPPVKTAPWVTMASFPWTFAEGKVILRSAGEFGAEVFAADGVFTIPEYLLPPTCLEKMKDLPPPTGMPPEFVPPEKEYKFFQSLEYGTEVSELIGSLGAFQVARPGFDPERNQPFGEYYWRMPSGHYFGVIVMEEKIQRKMLWKKVPGNVAGKSPIEDLFGN